MYGFTSVFYRYRKYAAQEPSEETIQGPTGFSGVQTRRNKGHSLGASRHEAHLRNDSLLVLE